jgi:hypothetical protein
MNESIQISPVTVYAFQVIGAGMLGLPFCFRECGLLGAGALLLGWANIS